MRWYIRWPSAFPMLSSLKSTTSIRSLRSRRGWRNTKDSCGHLAAASASSMVTLARFRLDEVHLLQDRGRLIVPAFTGGRYGEVLVTIEDRSCRGKIFGRGY